MTLTFSDRRLEQDFRRAYEQSTRANIPSGLIFSLLAWSVGVALTYLVYPQYVARLALVVGLTAYPYFLFVIYTAYHDRFLGHYQWLVAVTNAGAGMLAIYFFSFFPRGEYYTLIVLIFVLFFGKNAYRLQYLSG